MWRRHLISLNIDRAFDGCDTSGEILPEVEEDENSNDKCDDGHSVPKKEDKDLPFLDHTSMHV